MFGPLEEQEMAANTAATLEFCIFTKRLFHEKTRYISSDCSAEAFCRSSWPICYCLENRTGHTHNYCNGSSVARVNNIITRQMLTASWGQA